MTRRIRMLVVAAGVLVVCGGATVSSAAAVEFHSAVSTTYFKGHAEHLIAVNGGYIRCTLELRTDAAAGANPMSGSTAGTITLHPIYSNCKGFGKYGTVTTTECSYLFAASGTTSIVCASGQEIVFKASTGCTVRIGAQTPATPAVDYINNGSKSEFTVTSTVEGISYISSGGICGTSGTNGKYYGGIAMKGYSDSGFSTQESVWVE